MPEILKFKQEQVFYHVFSFYFLLYSVSKIKVKLALAIPKGAPVAVVKEIILHHLLKKEQLKLYLCNQIQLHIYLVCYRLTFFL